MDTEAVARLVSQDREEWRLLAAVLEARPDDNLHAPPSRQWVSRDVYAHLARWMDCSNRDIEEYCARGTLPRRLSEDEVEKLNSMWHQEDAGLTLAEAREKARQAFERRSTIIESVPIPKWDRQLEKIVACDGASHLAAHRSYIHLQ